MGTNRDNQELQGDATMPNSSERKWQQANRLLRMLNSCNQVVLRAIDEAVLLQSVCQIIVELGEYCAAWIGFAEPHKSNSIRPVAQAGEIEKFLQLLQSNQSEGELGQGATETAIRTGQMAVAQNLANDPQSSYWREFALQSGYESAIALPLGVDAQTLGVLTIYSVHPNAFNSNEVQLFSELANDLAYGIAVLRTRLERKTTEIALRESEARFLLTTISDRQRIEDECKLAAAKLRESEDHLRYMVELNPQVPWTATPDGRITDFNERWLKLTGLTREQAIGEGWAQVPHPDDLPAMVAAWTHSITTGDPYDIEHRIKLADGSYRWMRSRASSRRDEQGQIVRWYGTTEDIHDAKCAQERLCESEQRFRDMADNAPVMVWVTDSTGCCTYLSQSWYDFTGQTEATGLGLGWINAVHPDDRELAETLFLRANERQEKFHVEYRLRRQDGEYRWAIDAATPWFGRDGQYQGYIGSVIDITERKQAEIALSQLNEELEQRVSDRTAELSQLNDRLQQELQERERIQTQLEEQAQLLDLAHDPIMTRDPNGTITFWNHGAERMYGWTQTEALGQSSHVLLQTQFSQPLNEIETELLRHRYWEGELIHQRRDGTPIIVASRWVLQCDENSNPVKVLEINNDITSSKQAEEMQSRLAAIIESSDDAIISTTLDGIVDSWNWGAEKLYGYSAAEIVGQPTFILLPGDRLHEEAEIIQRLQQGDRVEHYETVRRHKEGRLIDISLTVSPLKDAAGEIIGLSKIARDITRRKQAEAQLQVSNERISLANAELARASRLKDEFLAGMSHELRTPLNAILGLSEALLEEIFGELTEEQRDHLRTIEQSGQHLLELINDILDLSKVESGKMELEVKPVNIHELCSSSLNFIKQQAHHKRIKLDCRIDEELTEAELDQRRIRQVLVNLLSNAVKFTPDGGSVQLQVRADAFRETIEFSITDTGIGIAPDNIGKLFQPFVQLDSSLSRRYAGSGLGLVLARRIAELHGGSITLESQEGKGSRFTVTLPWHPLTPDVEPAREASKSDAYLPNLQQALIVEDSQVAAGQIARYLTEMGVATAVHSIAGGVTQLAAQLKPDVIILDILLPDRSGWDVLVQLKANPETKTIPVVVISVVDERSHALALGATAYLLKPISRSQFQQTLNQVFSQIASSDQQPTPVVIESPASTVPLILLAEDNEVNIVTLNSYLQAHGLQVMLARNGLEATQMVKQHQPNLILMDVQMPEMDGLEAIQHIQSDPELQPIPIIALTALAMPGDRERCLEAGAVDYLTKPVSLKHLLNLLSHYIPQINFSKAASTHEP